MRGRALLLALVSVVVLAESVVAAEVELVRAYRSIYLGERREAILEAIRSDSAFRLPSWGVTSGNPVYAYTDIAGVPVTAYLYFWDDLLYEVAFYSRDGRSATHFELEVLRERDVFASVLTQAHGSPAWTREIAFWNLQPGYITWSHRWHKGDVTYRVGVAETTDWQYHAVLYITHEALARAKDAAEKAAAASSAASAAEDF